MKKLIPVILCCAMLLAACGSSADSAPAASDVEENFNIQMEKPVIKCIHSDKNNQCIKERCPFHE